MSDTNKAEADMAASEAAAALRQAGDASTVDSLRRFLEREVMHSLRGKARQVVINIRPGMDQIGIAALPLGSGAVPVAVAGSKDECAAEPQAWADARCEELIKLLDAAAEAKADAKPVQKA